MTSPASTYVFTGNPLPFCPIDVIFASCCANPSPSGGANAIALPGFPPPPSVDGSGTEVPPPANLLIAEAAIPATAAAEVNLIVPILAAPVALIAAALAKPEGSPAKPCALAIAALFAVDVATPAISAVA